jgi:hypothetical protein
MIFHILLVASLVVLHLFTILNEFQLAAALSIILLELFANDTFKYRRSGTEFIRRCTRNRNKIVHRGIKISTFIHFKYTNRGESICETVHNESELSNFTSSVAKFLTDQSSFQPTAGHTHTARLNILNVLGIQSKTIDSFDKKSSLRYSNKFQLTNLFTDLVGNNLFYDISDAIESKTYGNIYAPNDILSIKIYKLKLKSKTIKKQ